MPTLTFVQRIDADQSFGGMEADVAIFVYFISVDGKEIILNYYFT
jgi:hypothetical protein